MKQICRERERERERGVCGFGEEGEMIEARVLRDLVFFWRCSMLV